MPDAWDKAKAMADKHGGTLFARLVNDGDKMICVFIGEPYAFEVVWTGERYAPVNSDEAEHLVDARATLRVVMNVYLPDEDAVRIYEMGTITFRDQLCSVREKYGLDAWSYEVTRHGARGSSKTSYTILPEEKLDAEKRKVVAAQQLHDLAAVILGQQKTSNRTEDDIPF